MVPVTTILSLAACVGGGGGGGDGGESASAAATEDSASDVYYSYYNSENGAGGAFGVTAEKDENTILVQCTYSYDINKVVSGSCTGAYEGSFTNQQEAESIFQILLEMFPERPKDQDSDSGSDDGKDETDSDSSSESTWVDPIAAAGLTASKEKFGDYGSKYTLTNASGDDVMVCQFDWNPATSVNSGSCLTATVNCSFSSDNAATDQMTCMNNAYESVGVDMSQPAAAAPAASPPPAADAPPK